MQGAHWTSQVCTEELHSLVNYVSHQGCKAHVSADECVTSKSLLIYKQTKATKRHSYVKTALLKNLRTCARERTCSLSVQTGCCNFRGRFHFLLSATSVQFLEDRIYSVDIRDR